MKENFSFFQNRHCEFFPCHKLDENTIEESEFNCLFCYCPLYILGKDCGGNPEFLPNGIKDCTNCTFPHDPKNYPFINHQFKKISDEVKIVRIVEASLKQESL